MKDFNLDKYFDSFESTETTSAVLKGGKHVVKLIQVMILHSFINSDGTVKDKEYDFKDPNPQVGLIYGNDQGAILTRNALLGYRKFDELPTKDKESGKYVCSADGYALDAKTMERLPDAKRTADCRRILSRVFNAFDLPVGSGLNDLKAVIGTGKTVTIEVKELKGLDDKPYYEVSKVVKTAVGADVGAEAFE
jgi:hypothetical protein